MFTSAPTVRCSASTSRPANTIVRVTSTCEEPGAGEEVPARSLTRILRREYLRRNGQALVPGGRAMEERRYEMTLE